MSSIGRLVETWMASGREEEIREVVLDISANRITLLDVVKALGEYLTSEEDNLRSKGVEFLSLVLKECPPEKLNRQSIRVLTTFYCGKLDDTETIIPALKGLNTITARGVSEDAASIVQAYVDPSTLRSLITKSSSKQPIYSFDNLMARNRDALKQLGKSFLSGYSVLAEGEKDPRNLLVAFAIARVILIEFDISEHIERDTLQTMSICFPVYGSALARVSARKLWNAIKLEADSLTEEEALKTTRALVQTIYAQEEDAIESDDDVQGLARDVCEECIHILREPEKNQAKSAIKVLCAFMSTTPSVSRFTLSHAVPHFVKLFMNPDEVSNRSPILLLLADLVAAARDSMPSEVTDSTLVPMLPYKDEVLGLVSVGLKAANSRISAISLLRGLVTTKRLLSDEELGFIVHSTTEIFLDEDCGNDDFSDSAILEVLSTISQTAPQHLENQTLPSLFSALPEHAPCRDAPLERIKLWRLLLALKTLCVHPRLFEILVIRLTTKVELICLPSSMHDVNEDVEPDAAYAHSLLKTIADTLSVKIDAGHPDIEKYIDRLVPGLYNLFFFSALHLKQAIATDHRLVRVAGDIITSITQNVPPQRQDIFIRASLDVCLSGNVQGFAEGLQKFPADTALRLFDPSTSTSERNLLALLTAGVVTAHKEVLPLPPSLDKLLNDLLSWSILQSDHYLQRESAWHFISSVLNKHADTATAFLTHKIEDFWPKFIADTGLSTEQRRLALQAWAWISKALAVQKHASLTSFTDKLFELFADHDVSWDAAKVLGEIASTDQILTKRNHAVIKACDHPLSIRAGAKDPCKTPHEQTAYLVALTSLIKSSPKTAYAHQMEYLMPLLLRGLELPDYNIRADIIETLLAAAQGDASDHDLITEHAPALATYMLKNSLVQDMPSMLNNASRLVQRVRITALQYLNVLPRVVRYDVLHPSKSTVLRELAKVLDDPKRSVRKEAVDTRQVFIAAIDLFTLLIPI
ncbi:hypothetical protein H0H93_010205 [Arthromyces matolae]|nr:hypothetical protein H0H93_010205 [Arthromyces matolae]